MALTNITRLEVNSVLDREPKNYSNFCKTTPILSCFRQSYSIFNWIENYNMRWNQIILIYVEKYIMRKINFIYNYVGK